jgi:hypothetical protein
MCSELFAFDQSTVFLIIHEAVLMIDVVFKKINYWSNGNKMLIVMHEFKDWCGLPNIHGAIGRTHIAICKPSKPFVEDYYYHKSGGYSVVAQAMVDCNKQFLDLFVGDLLV